MRAVGLVGDQVAAVDGARGADPVGNAAAVIIVYGPPMQ
jgi:hypothetical protein